MNKGAIRDITSAEVERILCRAFPAVTSWKEGIDFTIAKLSEQYGYWNPIYRVKLLDKDVGVSELALKITNPHWANTSKTRNEAVIMGFLSKHMQELGLVSKNLVPRVHDSYTGEEWEGEGVLEGNLKYILMDFINGKNLDEIGINNYTEEQRHKLLDQIAEFCVALKSFTIEPQQMGSFRSLTLLSSSMLTLTAEITEDADIHTPPAHTMQQWVTQSLEVRIQQIEKLIERQPSFYTPAHTQLLQISKELQRPGVLDTVSWGRVPSERLSICHHDIQGTNIMVCEESFELKGIIDWEWASMFIPQSDFESMYASEFLQPEDANYLDTQMYNHALRIGELYPHTREFLPHVIESLGATPYGEKMSALHELVCVAMTISSMHTWRKELEQWDQSTHDISSSLSHKIERVRELFLPDTLQRSE